VAILILFSGKHILHWKNTFYTERHIFPSFSQNIFAKYKKFDPTKTHTHHPTHVTLALNLCIPKLNSRFDKNSKEMLKFSKNKK
jgi:hypothetical protein